MTVIFFIEHNCRKCAVTFENNGCNKVQNFKVIPHHENIILYIKPIETFLGKSQVCDMTMMLEAFDKSVFDGNTFLLEIKEENCRHRFIFIDGDIKCSFLTNDHIYKNIPNMGNTLMPYSIAKAEEYIYFLTPNFKFIKRDRIDDSKLLNTIENSVDPFDYHVSNCGKDSFRKVRRYKFPSNSY